MCCQLWELGQFIIVIGMRSGRQGFDFLPVHPYRTTQPPFQWVLVDERPGREADRSPPSCAEIKECVEQYLPCSIRLCGVAPDHVKGRLCYLLYEPSCHWSCPTKISASVPQHIKSFGSHFGHEWTCMSWSITSIILTLIHYVVRIKGFGSAVCVSRPEVGSVSPARLGRVLIFGSSLPS